MTSQEESRLEKLFDKPLAKKKGLRKKFKYTDCQGRKRQ